MYSSSQGLLLTRSTMSVSCTDLGVLATKAESYRLSKSGQQFMTELPKTFALSGSRWLLGYVD
jgi:hypothetical protein